MNMPSDCLIYGSTGYTGGLIAAQAVRRGLKPLLAGRNPQKLSRQAKALDLPWRAFELSDSHALQSALRETGLVLLIAGPYGNTARPVVEACLQSGAHYLDITGELDVYQWLWDQDEKARQAGVMLGSGMGFDVVPTDCLAAHLQERLPDANRLRIAFTWKGPAGVSHGTLRSGLRMLPRGLSIRKDGQLVQVRPGSKRMQVDFGFGATECTIYSWGDVVTAYFSTRIPNIEVYRPAAGGLQKGLNLLSGRAGWVGTGAFQAVASKLIGIIPNGTSADARHAAKMYLWAEVENPRADRISARMRTPEAYEFTASSTVLAVEKILSAKVSPGFQTPATAFGADFVLEIEGVRRDG